MTSPEEESRERAIHKWRWKNPYLAGFLAFLHPLGMLYTSFPAFLMYLAWWIVWFAYIETVGIGLLAGLGFGLYAYHSTRWKNAAIERWKYGLPGTGTQNPGKLGVKPLPDASRTVELDDCATDYPGDPSLSQAIKLTSEGNYHGARGELDRAIACFKKALSAKPNHVPAHLALATAYREKGEYQRALDVLSSAPSRSDPGEPMDFALEVAFHKASILIAKYQRNGFQGEMADLVVALEEARELGRRPPETTPSQQTAARAFGLDFQAERAEKLAMIEGLFNEVRKQSEIRR